MKTSYFAKSGHSVYGVSIAGRCPDWFTGREYKKLAPKYWFFKKFKEDGDEDYYIEQYQKCVLDTLDPQEVYNDLGNDAILLCWEKTEDFCHRHLVSRWLRDKLGIVIEEIYGNETKTSSKRM
jgi:hypothetical protein